ncbi:hypothetical protein IFM89_003537 [Coptis chinensis]|uniref:Uncharacterized protein n=1 Tax=Coptis chinensis TaxID=261450 RepID=A0A835ITK8_9MAGN|nr:hypothetical protein IFM89_003537 [Coptis chinensis]
MMDAQYTRTFISVLTRIGDHLYGSGFALFNPQYGMSTSRLISEFCRKFQSIPNSRTRTVLTGSPSHSSNNNTPPPRPPHNAPKPPSMRLQRIRPPPLSPIARPQHHNAHPALAPPPNHFNNGFVRPPPQMVQQPQYPPHGDAGWNTTAESPISAYMRYLQNSMNGGPSPRPIQGQIPYQHPPQGHGQPPPPVQGLLPTPSASAAFPSPRGGNGPPLLPSPTSQFLLPSPSAYMNLLSPRSPYPPLSPGFQFPPPLTPGFFSPFSHQSGILGPGPHPPPSPGMMFPPSPSVNFLQFKSSRKCKSFCNGPELKVLKSKVYGVGDVEDLDQITHVLGGELDYFPSTYLGLPLRTKTYAVLIEKMK